MSQRTFFTTTLLLFNTVLLPAQGIPAPGRYTTPVAWQQTTRDIYRQLIEINTTDSSGNTTEAANAMAKRLIDAGFAPADVQVLGPDPRKGNLVARLRGRNPQRKPLLLLAHIDVVEAKREDWSFDPFKFREEGGYFYARGTSDDKDMAAIWTATLIRMKQEGIVPDRDIIMVLTADEEGGNFNGVDWLIKNHRDLVEAAYGINEGGAGEIDHGVRLLNEVQASEKVFQSFYVEATNGGGHSSRPVKDNAIYHVAGALVRIGQFDFPFKLNEVTRAFFERTARIKSGQLAQDMLAVTRDPAPADVVARLSESTYYNALLRTTCVATMMQAGHAENALPQLARATVNCRMLPGERAEDVQATLTRVVADDKVTITPIAAAKPSQPSPLTPEVMGAIERITQEMWPGVPVVPTMGTGATDGLYFRNVGIPIYGTSGIFEGINESRAHGRDEREMVQSFFEGEEFLWRLVNALAVAKPQNPSL